MSRKFKPTSALRSKDILTAAVAWLEFGFSIVPLHGIKKSRCTCGDRSCENAGKHPISKLVPNGHKGASTDPDVIKAWLDQYPDANIGGVIPKGIVIVDVDGPTGRSSLNKLGNLPKAFTNRTGRGKHLFFRGNAETRLGLFPGIDLKAGGYVVLPPSRHASGKFYRAGVSRRTLPPLPAVFREGRKIKEKLNSEPDAMIIPKGTRDDTLFKFARQFRNMIDDDETVLSLLSTINRRHCSPPLSNQQVEKCALSAGNYPTLNEEYFGNLSDVEAKSVDWLWYPYIPCHAITLLAGDPGQGKSFLTMDFAACVSNQEFWPFSRKRPPGNKVLIMSSEDDAERAMLPRLQTLGADVKNIRYMKKFHKLDKFCMNLLTKEITDFRPALFIIDTISSYMGGDTDMYKQTEVQDFLVQITEIAQQTGTAVVAVAHLNKKKGDSAIHRVNGSIGFVAGVRSTLILGNNPSLNQQRALAHVKSNWGSLGPTLAFELKTGKRKDIPSISWIEKLALNADDICEPPSAPANRPARQGPDAEQYIQSYLEEHGETRWQEIEDAGVAEGHTKKTLVTARTSLREKKVIVKRREGSTVYWGLIVDGGSAE